MLNLNYLNIDIENAKKEHVEFFSCYVTKKLTRANCRKSTLDNSHPEREVYCTSINKRQYQYANIQFFINFIQLNNRLIRVLGGAPPELVLVNDEFILEVNNHFGIGAYEEFIYDCSEKQRENHANEDLRDFFKDVNAIFNYNKLSKDKHYSSYKLTENLGVRSCIYCNRTYALTHRKSSGHRLMNPQLDHWFPQIDYPLLQVSFHNLIPSCEICNSRVKNDTNLNLNDHFHPYQNDPEKLTFKYRFDVPRNGYRIYFGEDSDQKIKDTCELLFIDEMYNAHTEELEDLIEIKRAYSKEYLKSLKNAFPGANLSDELIYRLAFGTELMKKDFHKRPMSKFKHDILKELGIID